MMQTLISITAVSSTHEKIGNLWLLSCLTVP